MNGISRLLIAIVLCFFSSFGFSQKDTSDVALISVIPIPSEELVIIIGDYVLYDTAVSYPVLEKYSLSVKKENFTIKKVGIKNSISYQKTEYWFVH